MDPQRYARVKDIFLAASEMDDEGRTAFLDQACADDPTMRAEVESLLAKHTAQTLLADDASSPAFLRKTVSSVFAPLRSFADLTTGLTGVGRFVASKWFRVLCLLLTGAALFVLCYFTHQSVKQSQAKITTEGLLTVLEADVTALHLWIEERKQEAKMWAAEPRLRQEIETLVALGYHDEFSATQLWNATARANFYQLLRPYLTRPGSAHVALLDRNGLSLVSNAAEDKIGHRPTGTGYAYVTRALQGETVFVPPTLERCLTAERDSPDGRRRAVVAVLAPVRDAQKKIMAVLAFSKYADATFSRILEVARAGESGETYAFDKNGLLLSQSRFEDQLREIGMLKQNESSILTIHIRNPGGDLTSGFKTDQPPAARPLTKMAANAINQPNRANNDVDGYRDYRGVLVIGAWRWLPEYGFGVTTEIDYQEAYAATSHLNTASLILVIIVALCLTLLVVSVFHMSRLYHQVGTAKRLGQYTLGAKLGEGGMGVVHKATHALLRRPTAIKILKADHSTPKDVARFAREVQLASGLTHPNTIAIYDYGHAADGTLYYVMEYLAGLSLAQFIETEGAMPPGRVIHILLQVCASLREAHEKGLVHRDVKPANIMLSVYGGQPDFVKVLDFGLVKSVAADDAQNLTKPTMIPGTPMYIAPERLQNAANTTPRGDLYSVGVVGYNLLTGKDLFQCKSAMDILYHAVNVAPKRPSEVTTTAIPPGLEDLIMSCLEKSPEKRPAGAQHMIAMLSMLAEIAPWTDADAWQWWKDHPQFGPVPVKSTTEVVT